MSDIAPIPHALKVKARVARASLRLVTGGDLRFSNPRAPWKIEGTGSIEIDDVKPNAVSISLSENKAHDDTIFGSFQPALESGLAYLSLLLSTSQWQMMVRAISGMREFELGIDAVVSLDVPLAEYAESFGGEVAIFSITLSDGS